jgi:hypothetical protein
VKRYCLGKPEALQKKNCHGATVSTPTDTHMDSSWTDSEPSPLEVCDLHSRETNKNTIRRKLKRVQKIHSLFEDWPSCKLDMKLQFLPYREQYVFIIGTNRQMLVREIIVLLVKVVKIHKSVVCVKCRIVEC